MRMKLLCVAAIGVASALSACTSLSEVTKNPACVTRVSLKGSYGAGIPTGTYSASATCNAPVKAPASTVPAPPADDPAPPAPPG